MNFRELLKLNSIDPSKADYIQIGQTIKTKGTSNKTSGS